MLKFILKAFLRDKNRSLIPMIVVAIGVLLTVAMTGFMRGEIGAMVDITANFQSGHAKVMTRAYAENSEQKPNDLCLLGVDEIKGDLQNRYPNYQWTERILFGGLVDISDESGNTLGQGAASVMAVDLSKGSHELQRLNIENSIQSGALPQKENDVLLGYKFAEKIGAEVGDTLNFMGSTMNGSISFALYRVSGTLRFGNAAMDKSTIMMDLPDARSVMDMDNGASVILGFHKDGTYFNDEVVAMARDYNDYFADDSDEFLPTMVALRDQSMMAVMLDQSAAAGGAFIFIFLVVMAIVLWNTGLIAGLRRYQEFGIRLAIGERKGDLYRAQIYESLIVGVVGSLFGTILGVGVVYYFQINPIDISAMIPQSGGSMLMPSKIGAKMSSDLYYIGFVPGVIATLCGALLAGRGVYKRETSRLMKEMEI